MKYSDPTKVGEESRKSYQDKIDSGFFEKYMYGVGLDVGGKGYVDACAILPSAILVDLDYPGYDGRALPFPDHSQDYVYSSHTLEHILDYKKAIQEWHRVVKVGGYVVIVVPHRDLYEKKLTLPSNFNGDHKHFFTPGMLMKYVEQSLAPNTHRVRLLEDNDSGHDYSAPPEKHSNWCYEITLVLQKIEKPKWELK